MNVQENQAPAFGIKAAAIMAGVFLVVYIVFAALAAMDRANRSKLETMESLPIVSNPVGVPPK